MNNTLIKRFSPIYPLDLIHEVMSCLSKFPSSKSLTSTGKVPLLTIKEFILFKAAKDYNYFGFSDCTISFNKDGIIKVVIISWV